MYFLVSKGSRCVRLTTLPPSSAVVMKSGYLNFLELSGPLQACNGTDLSLFLLLISVRSRADLKAREFSSTALWLNEKSDVICYAINHFEVFCINNTKLLKLVALF